LQLAGLVSANELCDSFSGDIGRVFDLADIRVLGLAHGIKLKMMFWLLSLVHISFNPFPKGIITIERL
jgi:hypothetical protein